MQKRGFTLLELVMVLIVLAIAATMSISLYTKYRISARVSAMYSRAVAAQLAVINNYFGQGTTLSTIDIANGTQPFNSNLPNFITSIAIVDGVITATGNSTYLGGRSIVLTFTPSVSNNELKFTCTSNSANWEYVPTECRN